MPDQNGQLVRAGDAVLHHPTGETWLVATDEDERGRFYACGWPETLAAAKDCEVTRRATDEERLKLLREVADSRSPGGRRSAAIWQLDREELTPCCGAPRQVYSGDEGTNHYECSECGEAV